MSTRTEERPGARGSTGAATSDYQEAGRDQPTGRIGQLWQTAAAVHKQARQDRRERVLKYPDLVEQLKLPPINLVQPELWSGFIPPRAMPEQVCLRCASGRRCRSEHHHVPVNNTARRAALVAIADEAWRRDHADGGTPGE